MTDDQLLPEWAKPFGDAGDANDYWDLVCEVATLRWGTKPALDYLRGTVTMENGAVLNIGNIAADAIRYDQDTQRRGLYNFFCSFDTFQADAMADPMRDWEWARPRLRVRLQMAWEPGWKLVARPLDSRTILIVALDHESGCMPLAASKMDEWPVTEEEVWEIATANSVQQDRLERIELAAVRPRIYCFNGGMFTSGIALDLTGRLEQPLGDLGALVACPTAHITYVSPIRSMDRVQDTVARILMLSVMIQRDEPNPISTSVFWYRRPGVLEPGIVLSPPDRMENCFSEPIRTILDAA